MVAISACFEPPDFSETPQIVFNDIEFIEDEDGGYERLVLYLDFKDGDGNLGLSASDPRDSEFPYNSQFYYLQNGTGDTIPIIAKVVEDAQGVIYTILNDENLPGKVVTNKTRTLPNYGHLPVYDPNNCYNYKSVTTIIIGSTIYPGVLAPLSSVDATYNIEDTVTVNGKVYARISDLLLYRNNPNYYNIEVRFWQSQGGVFVEFDWYKLYCSNFYGRFVTSENDSHPSGDRPLEGTLRYAMESSSFLATFGSRLIKVTARIRDRDLNVSNTVHSPTFELNEIRED